MDISAKKWILNKEYKENDIISIGNLSAPDDIDAYTLASPLCSSLTY